MKNSRFVEFRSTLLLFVIVLGLGQITLPIYRRSKSTKDYTKIDFRWTYDEGNSKYQVVLVDVLTGSNSNQLTTLHPKIIGKKTNFALV